MALNELRAGPSRSSRSLSCRLAYPPGRPWLDHCRRCAVSLRSMSDCSGDQDAERIRTPTFAVTAACAWLAHSGRCREVRPHQSPATAPVSSPRTSRERAGSRAVRRPANRCRLRRRGPILLGLGHLRQGRTSPILRRISRCCRRSRTTDLAGQPQRFELHGPLIVRECGPMFPDSEASACARKSATM